jgi:RNA polymerase sigma-70 factor, ECF subfamily
MGTMSNDHQLVKQCLDGRSEAFGVLVERYQRPLYNAAYRILGNAQDAEDVTQTAFLKAYERLASFNPAFRFFSWMYRLTINEALNYRKRRDRHGTVDDDVADAEELPEDRPGEPMEATLEAAFEHLGPEDRAVLLLKHVEGFSYSDLAFIFDVEEKTIKSRLYTARQRLKDILIRHGYVHENARSIA